MEHHAKRPTEKGSGDRFTGEVWLDRITTGEAPPRASVSVVRFAPGARTAWHRHHGGQTLYVTDGRGLIQARQGKIAELRPGDIVWAPDGEEHWHGAAPDHFMTHLSITDGTPDWGDKVTDDEYGKGGGT